MFQQLIHLFFFKDYLVHDDRYNKFIIICQQDNACKYNLFVIIYMKEWNFRVFIDERGHCDFFEWRKNMPPKARARMGQIISHMEIVKDWTNTPYYTPLTGYEGIGEIKFIVQNRQYRPLGCRGPNNRDFTLLVGAREKGDRFEPLSAPETAKKRREMVLKDARYTDEYY